MKAQFVYEAIKHLSPKSQEEIMKEFNKLSPRAKLDMYKYINLELSKKQIDEILGDMTPSALAKFALEYQKIDLYKRALKEGHIMTASDKKKIIASQRYFDEYNPNPRYVDWTEIIEKYIKKGRKKIIDRDPIENKKDYDIARKKLNELKNSRFLDITTQRQEKNGTIMFRTDPLVGGKRIKVLFSLTNKGYIRRHWGQYSAPILENPYLTYSEMADLLIEYVIKNKYLK